MKSPSSCSSIPRTADRLQTHLEAMLQMLKTNPHMGCKVYVWSRAKGLAVQEPAVYGDLPGLIEKAMKEK